jgi:hypothetical protein
MTLIVAPTYQPLKPCYIEGVPDVCLAQILDYAGNFRAREICHRFRDVVDSLIQHEVFGRADPKNILTRLHSLSNFFRSRDETIALFQDVEQRPLWQKIKQIFVLARMNLRYTHPNILDQDLKPPILNYSLIDRIIYYGYWFTSQYERTYSEYYRDFRNVANRNQAFASLLDPKQIPLALRTFEVYMARIRFNIFDLNLRTFPYYLFSPSELSKFSKPKDFFCYSYLNPRLYFNPNKKQGLKEDLLEIFTLLQSRKLSTDDKYAVCLNIIIHDSGAFLIYAIEQSPHLFSFLSKDMIYQLCLRVINRVKHRLEPPLLVSILSLLLSHDFSPSTDFSLNSALCHICSEAIHKNPYNLRIIMTNKKVGQMLGGNQIRQFWKRVLELDPKELLSFPTDLAKSWGIRVPSNSSLIKASLLD